MSIIEYMLFCTMVAAQVGSPGPSVMLIISNSVNYGVRPAIYALTWDILGIGILAIISATGAALILENEQLFLFIQMCGGIYLLYLAYRKLVSYFSYKEPHEISNNGNNVLSMSSLGSQSFLIAVLNPKAIVFFSAIFPTLISRFDDDADRTGILFLLIGSFLLVKLLLLSSYAVVARKILKEEAQTLSILNLVGAIVFIIFSSYMLWDSFLRYRILYE